MQKVQYFLNRHCNKKNRW